MTYFSVFLLHTVKFACGALLCASMVCGDSIPKGDRPELLWQGTLQGTHDLFIRQTTVMVQDIAGPPATEVTYRFTTPLPKEDVKTTVDPRTTRGYVHIIQQPNMGNEYTLQIRIEDRQEGPAPYTLAVTWPKEAADVWSEAGSWPNGVNRRSKKAADLWVIGGQRSKITCRGIWTGNVKNSARLSIRSGDAAVVAGQASGRFDLIAGTVWPKRAYHPVVLATSAETQARIVELPDSRNGFAAVIEVHAQSARVNIEIAW